MNLPFESVFELCDKKRRQILLYLQFATMAVILTIEIIYKWLFKTYNQFLRNNKKDLLINRKGNEMSMFNENDYDNKPNP
jgi:predicted transcriptional regulator